MANKGNTFNPTRRKFFGQASCGAIGATTLFSTLFNLKSLNASASFNSSVGAMPGDYNLRVEVLDSRLFLTVQYFVIHVLHNQPRCCDHRGVFLYKPDSAFPIYDLVL